MSDLIERLRRGDASFYYTTMNEAADEIERLQRENEELRKAALKAQSTEPVADFKRRAIEVCIALIHDDNSEQYCMGAMWASERIRALPLINDFNQG